MINKRFFLIIVLTVIVFYGVYTNIAKAQKIVTDGLVSFWTLDKADITNDKVKDIVGNNHGKISGKPKQVAGKIKEALEFDGVADFIDCGTDDSLNLTKAITIETWIKPTSAGEGGKNAGPVCKAQSGNWGWQLRYNAPGGNFMGFQFNAGGSQWISVGQKLNPGEWYHIIGTYDGNEAICYLNGVVKNNLKMANILSSPDPFFIGQDGWVNVFAGVVDEVRIYKRALNANEVQQNFKSTSQLAVDQIGKLANTWGYLKVDNYK